MRVLIYNIFLIIISNQLFAQQTPATPQTGSILIQNAKLHVGDGAVIENALIGFENGKITLVGDARNIRIDKSIYTQIINAEGKEVYPGIIAPNTQIGLVEISAVRSSNDNREVGTFNPSIRSIIAYNTDSRVTPTIRSNGILLAEVVPQGGRIPGQSSIVELDGWNWEDAAYRTDMAIHLHWPRAFRRGGWWAAPGPITKNKDYDKQVQAITDFFAEAKAYSGTGVKNLKFEAMKGLFNGTKKLMIHCNHPTAIKEAVLFAKKHNIPPIIVGGRHAWRITDFLKEHNVPIILGATQDLPFSEDEDIDQPFKNATILEEAELLYAFSMNGAWQQRNLLFQAGQAVAFGLDYEDAIKGLTSNTAQILGIADKVGTITEGKDATLIIVKGDILDMRTSQVEKAFVRGKAIDLDNKQKALARKFRGKYQRQ